jgi:hypothetical protein
MEAVNNIIINIVNEYGYIYEYKCKYIIAIGIRTRWDGNGDGDEDKALDDGGDDALSSNDVCSSKDNVLYKFPL